MILATAVPDTWEVISIVAGVVSIALAFFAIWQATMFYRWSELASKNVEKASEDIASGVRKLEDLFDRLYSDTFGMMRDTVTDMRKHMWPATPGDEETATKGIEDLEQRTADNVARVREEMLAEMRRVVEQVGATTAQVADLETQLGTVLDRTIEGSREAEVEARNSTVKEALASRVRGLRRRGAEEIDADSLLDPVAQHFTFEDAYMALMTLRKQHMVDWEDPLGPETPVRLLRPKPSIRRRPGARSTAETQR